MQGKRIDRVAHLVQMQLAELLLREAKDPRLSMVTIIRVSMAPDLKSGMVFYSVIGDREKKEAVARSLKKAGGFLQSQVGARLELRYTPRLQFRLDESQDQAEEVDRILRGLKSEEEKPEA